MPRFGDDRMITPWGKSDSTHKIMDGVYRVSTPSHGGYMVGKAVAAKLLTKEARQAGMAWGNWLCYEEDCAWAVAATEIDGIRQHICTETQQTDFRLFMLINTTVQHYYPEYWNATHLFKV